MSCEDCDGKCGGDTCKKVKTPSRIEFDYCLKCPYSQHYYLLGGGIIIICRLTGESKEYHKCVDDIDDRVD